MNINFLRVLALCFVVSFVGLDFSKSLHSQDFDEIGDFTDLLTSVTYLLDNERGSCMGVGIEKNFVLTANHCMIHLSCSNLQVFQNVWAFNQGGMQETHYCKRVVFADEDADIAIFETESPRFTKVSVFFWRVFRFVDDVNETKSNVFINAISDWPGPFEQRDVSNHYIALFRRRMFEDQFDLFSTFHDRNKMNHLLNRIEKQPMEKYANSLSRWTGSSARSCKSKGKSSHGKLKNVMKLDCKGVDGMSGSPVFDSDGPLVGIVVGTTAYSLPIVGATLAMGDAKVSLLSESAIEFIKSEIISKAR